MELASKLNLLVGVTAGLGLAAWVDRRRGSRSSLDLDAIAPHARRKTAGSLNYVVQFVSVDGAGRYDEIFTDLADAKAFADAKQADSDENGNPWGYAYNVLHEKFERPPLYRTSSRGSRSSLDLDAIFAEVEAREKVGGAKVKKPKAKPKTRTRPTPQQTSVTWQPSAALSQHIDAMLRQIDEGGAEKRAWQNEGSKRWLAQAQVLLDQARFEDYAKAMTGYRQRGEQLYDQARSRRRKSYEVGSLLLDEFYAAVERLPAKQRKIEGHALKWHDRRTPYNQEYHRLARLLEADEDAPTAQDLRATARAKPGL